MTDEMLQEFTIPASLIDQWLQISPTAPVQVTLTRQDIDNLFFSITNITKSLVATQNCLLYYSQGRLDEANKALSSAQRLTVQGDNNIRMFMNAVIAGAKTGG